MNTEMKLQNPLIEEDWNKLRDVELEKTERIWFRAPSGREVEFVKPKRWIPVKERLPNRNEYIKNNGLFIVSDGNRSYSEWFDIYDKQRFGEPTMDGFRVDYAVAAWMSLPDPYKAESEDKK